MAAKLQAIINLLEEYAPPVLTEDWDNSGLQIGDRRASIGRVLLTLDVNGDVVREAIEKRIELIISHHPLIFQPIKNVLYNTPEGALLTELIRNDISVYSAHTNLDKALHGVNDALARVLGLGDLKVLKVTDREQYYKLVVFVPVGYVEAVREAIAAEGAGFIGNYRDCSFLMEGVGMFRPLEGADPFTGKHNELTRENELRLETIVPAKLIQRVIQAMLKVHPYEEVAYDLYPLKNGGEKNGFGLVGKLSEPVTLGKFIEEVKRALALDTVRAGGDMEQVIGKVAVCGGSGSNFWKEALRLEAGVFVTGDIGFHTAQNMLDAGLPFIDAGHYATERPVLKKLERYLSRCAEEQQLGLEILISDVNTNPFVYV